MGVIGFVKISGGDKVTFHIKPRERVCYGQIVRFSSPDSGQVFYGRVVNTKSKTLLSELDELKEFKGTEPTGPYAKTRDVEAILFLEQRRGEKPRPPTFNPGHAWEVSTVGEDDYSNIHVGGEYPLGWLRSGEEEVRETAAGIDSSAIPYMMCMVGKIGSGKSNAEILLNAQIMDSGRAVGLIFDFAGEILNGKGIGAGLIDHPQAPTKLVYFGEEATLGKESDLDSILRKAAEKVPMEELVIGRRSISPQDVWSLFKHDFTIPQYDLAKRAKLAYKDEWIDELITREFETICTDLREKRKDIIGALMRKLRSLDEAVFRPKESYNAREKIISYLNKGRSVLCDLSGLELRTQIALAELIAWRIAEYYKWLWKTDHERWKRISPILITIEEAHQFLAEKKTVFSDIAMTYRKFGVGINAVTPRPHGINPDVFAELWTKLIFKNVLKADRSYIVENTPYLDYSDTEIKMLGIGEALLVSELQKAEFAVPIKVIHYPEYLRNLQ